MARRASGAPPRATDEPPRRATSRRRYERRDTTIPSVSVASSPLRSPTRCAPWEYYERSIVSTRGQLPERVGPLKDFARAKSFGEGDGESASWAGSCCDEASREHDAVSFPGRSSLHARTWYQPRFSFGMGRVFGLWMMSLLGSHHEGAVGLPTPVDEFRRGFVQTR